MKSIVWCLLIALVLLHQWDPFGQDRTLVAGAVPAGLLYHVGISLSAAVVWMLAARFCWPRHLSVDAAHSRRGEPDA